MDRIKNVSAAFTGHRRCDDSAEIQLTETLEQLYSRGFRRFMTGMAWGFDLIAGKAVAEMKLRYDDVHLTAVLPFADFRTMFHGAQADLYDEVLRSADEVVCVGEEAGVVGYMIRNNYLADNASIMVAWYDGGSQGGTAYTVKRARRNRLPVINLYPSIQQTLF